MPAKNCRKVIIIDDHPLFRKGVTELLNGQADFKVIGEAAAGAEGVELSLRHEPDLILLDLNMKDMNGIQALTALKKAAMDSIIIMLTVSDTEENFLTALRSGADGYLLKDTEPELIVAKLRSAINGEIVIDDNLTRLLAHSVRENKPPPAADFNKLSEREREIVKLIVKGMSNKLIARALGITEGTVKVHVKNMLRKLQLGSRLEVALWAIEQGYSNSPLDKKVKPGAANAARPAQTAVAPRPDNPALLDGLHQTLFQVNERGQWVYLNAEWERLTGFTVAATLGMDMLRYIHPDDKRQCADFMREIYKNNPSHAALRLRFLTRDDHLCWSNMRANTYIDPLDKKRYLAGVISDITERVREYGLRQANYRTLSTLIDNLCGLVYRGRNDRQWTMEFVSAGCLDLTGYLPSDMINKTVTFGSLISPNDQDLVWNNVQTALAENRAYEINYRIRTKSGAEKWVWERGRGNFSSNGELLSIEGLIVDITDYKRNFIRDTENILYKTRLKLPQKYLFMDRLDRAVTKHNTVKDYEFALLILHIDRFNKLKDRYSATIIDQIILDVCERLAASIRPADSLCMFNEPGEFGILMEHIETADAVRKMAGKIQRGFLQPVKINRAETYLTASIGISISENTEKNRDALIQDAYSALNRAKSLGGSRYEISDEAINTRLYVTDRMENELCHALDNDALSVGYQPIAGLKEKAVTGLEIQLFWEHPRKGKLSADTFASVTAEPGVAARLNQWLISAAAGQIRAWAGQSRFRQSLSLVIRFCGEKILPEELQSRLEPLLSGRADDPHSLQIKLPGAAIAVLTKQDIATLTTLKQKNIGLVAALDDSDPIPGRKLLELQVTAVQLNSVADIKNDNERDYLKARIDFIHALGMDVMINGVADKKQFAALRSLGCDYIQGDIISPPLEHQALTGFIDQNKLSILNG